jgi:hypothetical protein
MIFIFYGFHNPFGESTRNPSSSVSSSTSKCGKLFFGKLLANILGTAKTLIALE